MDYIVKKALKKLAIQREPIEFTLLCDLVRAEMGCPEQPKPRKKNKSDESAIKQEIDPQDQVTQSFNNDMLKARLKTMKSVLFKSDKTKSHKDDSLHCWLDEQAKLQYSKADRMLFYIDQKEFKAEMGIIYEIILRAGTPGIKYTDIQSELTKIKKKSKTIQQISHYCRKLFNIAFINIKSESHYKIAVARRFDRSHSIPEVGQSEKKSNYLEFLQTQTFVFRELGFMQNIWVNLGSEECVHNEGYQLSQIQNKMNKVEEKKSICRLFELQKSLIDQIADRQGRFFSYRYRLLRDDKQIVIFPRIEGIQQNEIENVKREKLENIDEEQNEADNEVWKQEVVGFVKYVEIGGDALQDILMFVKVENESSDNVLRALNQVCFEKVQKKTQPSRQRLNRYALLINKIYEQKVIIWKDLRQVIIEYEKNEITGEIDGRTHTQILKTLAVVRYIKMLKEEVEIASKKCSRYLIIHHSVDENSLQVKEELSKLHDIRNFLAPNKQMKMRETSKHRQFDDTFVEKVDKKQYHADRAGERFKYIVEQYTILCKKTSIEIIKSIVPTFDDQVLNSLLRRPDTGKSNGLLNLLMGVQHKLERKHKQQHKQDGAIMKQHLHNDQIEWDEINHEINADFSNWSKETTKCGAIDADITKLPEVKRTVGSENQLFQSSNSNNSNISNSFKVKGQPQSRVMSQFERLKEYLFYHPTSNLQHLASQGANLNIYRFLHKCLRDQTVKITFNGEPVHHTNLNQIMNEKSLESILYHTTNQYFAYYI